MIDLESLRRDNDAARRIEEFQQQHAALPWRARLRRLLIVWYIGRRETLRDALLEVLGRPHYVRCSQFCKVFRSCHRDATRSLFADGMPILCAECDEADGCPPSIEVGRWHRGPVWTRSHPSYPRLLRPEGKPLGWTRSENEGRGR